MDLRRILPSALLSCLFLASLRKACKNQLAGSGARLTTLAIKHKLEETYATIAPKIYFTSVC